MIKALCARLMVNSVWFNEQITFALSKVFGSKDKASIKTVKSFP